MWLDTVVDRRTVLCILDEPPASGDELLRRVLTDFGILGPADAPAPRASSGELTQVLQQFLASLRTLNAHAFVVIENAQAAADPTRAEIDRLSALDPSVLEVLLVEASSPAPAGKSRRRAIAGAALAGVAVAVWLWGTRGSAPPPAPAPTSPTAQAAPANPIQAPAAPALVAVPPRNVKSDATAAYRVQIGAFRDSARADDAVARFQRLNQPVDAHVTGTGLRQIALGPYVLRAEATAALAEARIAGFQDAVMVKVAPKRDAIAASDRHLLDKAEALAEAHDVRGLESLRIAWIDASGGTRRSSPTLTAIDEYLDAARRVQLAIDRQHLLGSAPQR